MFGRIAKSFVVITLVLAMGWHWIILQSVAWVTMAADYSKQLSVTEALKKTFDGQNPCRICRFVAEGKKAEKENEVQKSLPKLDLLLARDSVVLYPPTEFAITTWRIRVAELRAESPPFPPPRLA